MNKKIYQEELQLNMKHQLSSKEIVCAGYEIDGVHYIALKIPFTLEERK